MTITQVRGFKRSVLMGLLLACCLLWGVFSAANATGQERHSGQGAKALVSEGYELFEKGMLDEALNKFESAIQADREYCRAHSLRADLMMHQGRDEEAKKSLKEAGKLADKAQKAGNREEARGCLGDRAHVEGFLILHKIKPSDNDRKQAEYYEKALKKQEEAARIDPMEARHQLSISFLVRKVIAHKGQSGTQFQERSDHLRKAAGSAHRALALRPGLKSAQEELAWLSHSEGISHYWNASSYSEYEVALGLFDSAIAKRAIQILPAEGEMHLWRGLTLTRMAGYRQGGERFRLLAEAEQAALTANLVTQRTDFSAALLAEVSNARRPAPPPEVAAESAPRPQKRSFLSRLSSAISQTSAAMSGASYPTPPPPDPDRPKTTLESISEGVQAGAASAQATLEEQNRIMNETIGGIQQAAERQRQLEEEKRQAELRAEEERLKQELARSQASAQEKLRLEQELKRKQDELRRQQQLQQSREEQLRRQQQEQKKKEVAASQAPPEKTFAEKSREHNLIAVRVIRQHARTIRFTLIGNPDCRLPSSLNAVSLHVEGVIVSKPSGLVEYITGAWWGDYLPSVAPDGSNLTIPGKELAEMGQWNNIQCGDWTYILTYDTRRHPNGPVVDFHWTQAWANPKSCVDSKPPCHQNGMKRRQVQHNGRYSYKGE